MVNQLYFFQSGVGENSHQSPRNTGIYSCRFLPPSDSPILTLSTFGIRGFRDKSLDGSVSIQLLHEPLEDHHCVVQFLSCFFNVLHQQWSSILGTKGTSFKFRCVIRKADD